MGTKNDFQGKRVLPFPEAVVTSTVKESLYQTRFTTSCRFFLGVETAVYKYNNFGSNGKPMLLLSVVHYQVLRCLDMYDVDTIAINGLCKLNFRYFTM